MATCLLLTVFISSTTAVQIPYWSAPYPNASAPLGGYKFLENRTNYEVFHGTLVNDSNGISGAYNHAVMIGYHNGIFTVLWKNGKQNEDQNGQRILYSQSQNGKDWTSANIFFHNISTPYQPTAMFVGPPIIINGRQYVGASPGEVNHSLTAQGSQFCLYPQPINPRNCGPASEKGIIGQENNTLLMREILPGIGNLGKIFWATYTAPIEFQAATKAFEIPTLTDMDKQTQNDIGLLTKQMDGFCDGENNDNETLKCEVVQNGVKNYRDINESLGIANELSHYILPSKSGDILLYRSSSSEHRFYVSLRNISSNGNKKVFGNWSKVMMTDIPDVNSNLNCGTLPNNKIYLLSNPVYNQKGRNPLTIGTSKDGYNFDKVGIIMSCTELSSTSTCEARNTGNKDGPAYPQGTTVVSPAPSDVQGFWVAASNNKEDIWVTHVPFSAVP
eukprot:66582_1